MCNLISQHAELKPIMIILHYDLYSYVLTKSSVCACMCECVCVGVGECVSTFVCACE